MWTVEQLFYGVEGFSGALFDFISFALYKNLLKLPWLDNVIRGLRLALRPWVKQELLRLIETENEFCNIVSKMNK